MRDAVRQGSELSVAGVGRLERAAEALAAASRLQHTIAPADEIQLGEDEEARIMAVIERQRAQLDELHRAVEEKRSARAAVRDALSCITPSYTSIKTRRTLVPKPNCNSKLALHKRKVKKSPRDEIAFALAQRGARGRLQRRVVRVLRESDVRRRAPGAGDAHRRHDFVRHRARLPGSRVSRLASGSHTAPARRVCRLSASFPMALLRP